MECKPTMAAVVKGTGKMTLDSRRKQLGWERRQELLKHLRIEGSASVADMCTLVGASPATVHRDLDHMAEKGLIKRVHGGALAAEAEDDPPVTVERQRHILEKQQIADEALKFIGPSVNSIFLEASTTVSLMCPALRMMDKVVVTNSPDIALEVVGGNAEVVLIGGNLRHRTLAAVGPSTISALQAVSIDLAFIGVSAVDETGLSSMNIVEAETKSAIVSAARIRVALCDSTKIGRRALVPVSPLSSLSFLITDGNAPKDQLAKLRHHGVEVVVARVSKN